LRLAGNPALVAAGRGGQEGQLPQATEKGGATTEDGLQYFVTSQTFTAVEIPKLATYAMKSFQLLGGFAQQTRLSRALALNPAGGTASDRPLAYSLERFLANQKSVGRRI